MDALRATDAILFGNNRFDDWLERFEAQWNAPDMMMVDVAWRKLPQEVRDAIRNVAPPELINALDGGGQDGSTAMAAKHNQPNRLPANWAPAAGSGLRPNSQYPEEY